MVAPLFVIEATNPHDTDDIGNPLYWSNEEGWTTSEAADVYTLEEREHSRLPIDSRWRGIS